MARHLNMLVWPMLLAFAAGCGDPEVALQLEASEAKVVGLEEHVRDLEQELAETRQEVERLEDELAQAERDARDQEGSRGGEPAVAIEPSAFIRKLSDDHYAVDADMVSLYMTQLKETDVMGRAIPHRGADGEVDGYQLTGLARGSLGALLGLQNGDVLQKVNGLPLTSMNSAMAAFSAIPEEKPDELVLQVRRRSEVLTLRYSVAGLGAGKRTAHGN